jgi:hypothetical protein
MEIGIQFFPKKNATLDTGLRRFDSQNTEFLEVSLIKYFYFNDG